MEFPRIDNESQGCKGTSSGQHHLNRCRWRLWQMTHQFANDLARWYCSKWFEHCHIHLIFFWTLHFLTSLIIQASLTNGAVYLLPSRSRTAMQTERGRKKREMTWRSAWLIFLRGTCFCELESLYWVSVVSCSTRQHIIENNRRDLSRRNFSSTERSAIELSLPVQRQ